MYKKILLSFSLIVALDGLNATNLTKPDELLKIANKNVKQIDTENMTLLLKKSPNIKVIDIRNKTDILAQHGFIKANLLTNIPRGQLEFEIEKEVKKDEIFIVYGFDGTQSSLAAYTLKQMGYSNVIHYKDGFKAWNEAGLKISSLDKNLESLLYGKIEKVAPGVYTSIGQTSPGTYQNSGHNNNLGFVVGENSVLVWNASRNYLLAKAFHAEILKVTNKPIKYVVLENSQGHAMGGASYYKDLGATIVAQELAKEEIIHKIKNNFVDRIYNRYKDKALGTKLIVPDVVFKDEMSFDLGGRTVIAKYFGYAHEFSDICIWLPKEEILFAGDLAFQQRLLPIFEITRIPLWLEAWEKLAKLNAKIVIPGHGDTTDMVTVEKYTKGYLVYLRAEVEKVLEDDGGLAEAYEIDMTAYQHLDTFRELGKQNIARVFKQMEFE